MIFNTFRLKDISRIIGGGTPSTKKEKYWNGNISWLTPKDLSGYTKQYISYGERSITTVGYQNSSAKMLPKNTVLLSSRAPIGYVAIAGKELCTNQGFKNLICNENICYYEFLYYWLLNNVDKIEAAASGSTFLEVSKTTLGEIEIKLPSLQNQKKVVKILSTIDKKIESNNQINDNLLELSQQLFKDCFNDSDGMSDVKLSEICVIRYGKNLPTKNIISSGYPVYGGNGIIGYYNEKVYTQSQILISCRGAASGKTMFTKPNCFVTNNSLILDCEDKYHHFLKEFSLLNNYYQYATGSAQPQITIENIKDIKIKIPNDETLNKYNVVFNSIESQYFKNVEQTETLTQLRDTLLPKLMNGEIDLENIEI